MVGLSHQDSWIRWNNLFTEENKLVEDLALRRYRIKFIVQSVYNVLPSPANLYT